MSVCPIRLRFDGPCRVIAALAGSRKEAVMKISFSRPKTCCPWKRTSPESCFPCGKNISYSRPLSIKVVTAIRKVRCITGQGQKPRNYMIDTLPPSQITRSHSWKSWRHKSLMKKRWKLEHQRDLKPLASIEHIEHKQASSHVDIDPHPEGLLTSLQFLYVLLSWFQQQPHSSFKVCLKTGKKTGWRQWVSEPDPRIHSCWNSQESLKELWLLC